MQLKAFIFDWDGVVIDSAFLHRKSWEELSKELGKDLPENHFELGFGKRNQTIIPEILDWSDDDFEIDKWGKRKEAIYRQLGEQEGIQLQPGIKGFLADLSRHSYLTCVATSTERKNVLLAMQQHGLEPYFHGVVSSEDVTLGKPDPEVFIKAALKLGCTNTECVVFEDSPHGILAAQRAHMKTIALTTSHSKDAFEQLKPDLIISSFENLSIDNIRGIN